MFIASIRRRRTGVSGCTGPTAVTSRSGEAFPRDPIGEADAVRGFSAFVVSWPYFIVTASRVTRGDGTGCHELAGTAAVS